MEDDYSIACDRPRREIRRPTRYVDSEGLVAYALTVAEKIFESAMQEEMESLHKNRT